MNDYCYKPKKNPLPKLNLANLNTQYNTFYSKNSKSKANISNYNTFRIFSKNQNTSNFSSIINSNENEKIYLKTARNFYNKNLKKKNKPNLKYLTEFSDVQTDDTYFALSEIKRIDTNIKKRINKNIIWKEKQENIYDILSSKNKSDIKNAKNRARQNMSEINFNLRKENNKNNYFPSENIETIKDANKIISKIKNSILQETKVTQKYHHFNKINLHTFRAQNRDICLNNILINIIKSELKKIKKKENTINSALKEANKDFAKDKDLLENFTQKEINNFRLKEIKLDEAIKKNKSLYDDMRKIKSELYATKDEVKKYIKDIILFIKYENFIKKILSEEDSSSNLDLLKLNYIKNDKDLDIIIKNIINEYYIRDMDNLEILTKDLKPNMITNLFMTMESNIINVMKERDLILKEIKNEQKKYEKGLEDLKMKVLQNQHELNIIYKELNIVNNLTTPKVDLKDFTEENEKYIMILYKELSNYFKDKIDTKTNNLCLDTLSLLHSLEEELLTKINELNKITSINEEDKESNDRFKEIIEKLKLENKRKKQDIKKDDAKKQFEEKIKKSQQRAIRYQKRGPITFPPPWAINKSKKKKNIKKSETVQKEELLYY